MIQFPDTHVVNVKEVSVTVSGIAGWPEHVQQKIYDYGLRQILADAAAPAKTDAEREAAIQKRADNLAAGTLRATVNRVGDPIKAEALRLATKAIEAALVKAGKKVKDYGAKQVRAKAEELIGKNPDYMTQAKLNVEAAKELDIGDIEV